MKRTTVYLGIGVLLILALSIFASCRDTIGEPVIAVEGGDPKRGVEVIDQYECGTCHTIPGIEDADGTIAPPLNFWSERSFIAGSLSNEPDNLITWIMNPQAIEPGTAMPNLGLTEAQARDIAAYLYTLD